MTSPSPASRQNGRALPSRTIAEAARGALASLVLAALVLAMPVALWALGGSLRLAEGFDLSRLGAALTRPDDGSLLLLTVLLIAWGAWAVFSLSVVVEVVALLRGMPTPHLPLLKVPQQGAAALVATAALLVTSAGATSHAPVARPVASVAVLDLTDRPVLQAPTSPSAEPSMRPAAVEEKRAGPAYPTVTVRRHDTLWSLAEIHLRSGARFREIVALNRGRPQSDGRTLKDAGWIYPGWVLRLPVDARMSTESRSTDRPANGPDETYVVERGDSLWQIAEGELGEGERYGEIHELNEGRRQPDGMRLTDADEIRPGWRLRLPVQPPAAPGEHPAVAPHRGPATPNQLPEKRPPTSPVRTPGEAGNAGTPNPAPTIEEPAQTNTGEHAGSVAPTLVLGLGTIVLTGLVGEVTRRRRLQQRSRRTGRRIAMPAAAPEAAEQQARAASDPVTVETLKMALRALSVSCRDAGRPLPDVVVIRVTSAAIELNLLADDGDPVAPFRAADARNWRLDAMPVTPPDDDVEDPFPALVTVGVDDDALVLLNLEAVGSVTLMGPQDATQSVLRALAMDLAVGSLVEGHTLTFVGCFADLAQVVGPGSARFLADGSVAVHEAEVRSTAIRRALESSGATGIREARAQGVASDATRPEILLAAQELPNAPVAWSGVAAAMPGQDSPDGRCTLRVRSDGFASLDPPGIDISPQRLTSDDYDALVSLLATAAPSREPATEGQPLAEKASARDLGGDRNASLEALPDPPEDQKPITVPMAVPPRVLLLGPVHVEGADDGSAPGRRRRATELVSYLALHGGATTHQIDEAIWPGRRVAKNTRNPFVSRVRQWLGRTPDGEPYLPLVAEDGEYRLRPEVGCDWHDFLRLARSGLSQGPDGVTDLAAALQRVRGRPFLGIDPATYTWAEADIQEMISAIVDVAHVLSATLYEAGDHRGAEEAAARGLLVEPCSAVLYRDAIRAAAARGDRQQVQRLADRLRQELAAVDPDDGMDLETADLLSTIAPR